MVIVVGGVVAVAVVGGCGDGDDGGSYDVKCNATYNGGGNCDNGCLRGSSSIGGSYQHDEVMIKQCDCCRCRCC